MASEARAAEAVNAWADSGSVTRRSPRIGLHRGRFLRPSKNVLGDDIDLPVDLRSEPGRPIPRFGQRAT